MLRRCVIPILLCGAMLVIGGASAARAGLMPRAEAQAGQLSITNVSQSPSGTVPLYEKVEITFEILNTIARNLQWPCDTTPTIPTSGSWALPTGVGISVDAVFSKGPTVVRQPAFLYVPYAYDTRGGEDWASPSGPAVWMVRFAAQEPGAWSYHIEARDGTSCERFARYPQSGELALTVGAASAGNHGFIRVSPTDPRYFEFSDGTPFIGVGHGHSFSSLVDATSSLTDLGINRVNFIRVWYDSSLVWSRGIHGWDAWRTADGKRDASQRYGFSDFSIRLSGNNSYIFQTTDGNQYITGGLESNKRYVTRVRAKLVNVTAASTGSGPKGLVVKLHRYDDFDHANTVLYLTPTGFAGNTDWQVFEGVATNTLGRINFAWGSTLMIGLQNVTGGTAYIDELYIGEDLGTGEQATLDDLSRGLGPNAVFKGDFNYHQAFDQRASYLWDRILDLAKTKDVYLKLVASDMRDGILACIDTGTGVFDQSSCDDYNFLSARGIKVRRLQEYYWRYLIARWGYSPALHSWELTNEGPPFDGSHENNSDHMAEYFRANDPNKHLITTSYWHSFADSYYNDPGTQVHYADFHAYNSADAGQTTTGWIRDPSIVNDMARFHYQYSQDVRSRLDPNRQLPIVRGEAGISSTQDWNTPDSRMWNDRNGVWLHNFTWALLDPGAVYELYWYSELMWNNDLHFQYKAYRDFMDGVPINNGLYQDAAATGMASNVRVLGQKDIKGQPAEHAVLWIQNKNHTWINVINGAVSGRLSGTVTLSGFQPSATFPVEWWDFVTAGTYAKRTASLSSDAQGRIVLDLNAYTATITDTAVKIGDFAAQPPPTPTFVDVPFSHPYHDVIEALYQAGYTAGCNTDPLMYCPEATMNRAESAVFVERGIHGTSGLPPQPTTQTFADLPLDSWAAKWAEALWQDHYTAGCGTDPLVYCPWQGHTRAEGCVFYLHMLNGPTYQPPQPSQQTFADVPLEAWYAKWVQAGYDARLLEPCQTTPDLRFCPNDPLSRALAAYMMVQAKGLRGP